MCSDLPLGFIETPTGLECPHPGREICRACLDAYPEVMDICGRWVWVEDEDERDEILGKVTIHTIEAERDMHARGMRDE